MGRIRDFHFTNTDPVHPTILLNREESSRDLFAMQRTEGQETPYWEWGPRLVEPGNDHILRTLRFQAQENQAMPRHEDPFPNLHAWGVWRRSGASEAFIAFAVILGIFILAYAMKDDDRAASTTPPTTVGQTAPDHRNPLRRN